MELKKAATRLFRLSCVAVSCLMALMFLVCVCTGLGGVFEIPVLLSMGWLIYLSRVLPPLYPDPFVVALGFVFFVVVTVCTQAVADRLYSATGPNGEVLRWPWKRTFQLIGLVVLVFLGGLAAMGLIQQSLGLIRLREPWIENRSTPTFHRSGSTAR
jgi:hypothetical protein